MKILKVETVLIHLRGEGSFDDTLNARLEEWQIENGKTIHTIQFPDQMTKDLLVQIGYYVEKEVKK